MYCRNTDPQQLWLCTVFAKILDTLMQQFDKITTPYQAIQCYFRVSTRSLIYYCMSSVKSEL